MSETNRFHRAGSDRKSVVTIAAVAVVVIFGWGETVADDEYKAIRAATANIADAVMQIETIGSSTGGGELSLSAPISGTVISADGYVITSLWGLEETPASILVVGADGTRMPAKLVARDHSRELALLKVNPKQPLTFARMNSTSSLTVGQWAIAVGRGITPKRPAVSVGIVSATERMHGRVFQMDARISPSFYGGAVVDIRGNLIGISVPMKPQAGSSGEKSEWYDSGIAFVVPVGDIASRLDKLKQGKDIQAGKLGVVPTSKMPFSEDRTLKAVRALSPARKAGIQAGDEILAIDGVPVRFSVDIQQLLGPRDAGESIRVAILRDKQELEVDVKLAADIPPFKPQVLGILAEVNTEGIVIEHVFPDSPAAKAELAKGDFIQKIDEAKVTDVDQLRSRVMTQASDEPLTLQVQRDGKLVNVKCDLVATPGAVPAEMPAMESIVSPADWTIEDNALADVANACFLLKPKQNGQDLSMLVLLARPGSDSLKKDLEDWRETASENNLCVMLVASTEKDRWKPAESDVIVRMVAQTKQSTSIADNRIVVSGYGSGVDMSMMVALRNRAIFRGTIATTASKPGGFSLTENDPATPIQLLIVGAKQTPAWAGIIARFGFPVIRHESTAKQPLDSPQVREAIGRWIRSLDRI